MSSVSTMLDLLRLMQDGRELWLVRDATATGECLLFHDIPNMDSQGRWQSDLGRASNSISSLHRVLERGQCMHIPVVTTSAVLTPEASQVWKIPTEQAAADVPAEGHSDDCDDVKPDPAVDDDGLDDDWGPGCDDPVRDANGSASQFAQDAVDARSRYRLRALRLAIDGVHMMLCTWLNSQDGCEDC